MTKNVQMALELSWKNGENMMEKTILSRQLVKIWMLKILPMRAQVETACIILGITYIIINRMSVEM